MFEVKKYIKASRDWNERKKQKYELWQRDCWKAALKCAEKYSNVALYGAGNHTKKILNFFNAEELRKVKCIIALEDGAVIKNLPVVTIDKARKLYHVDAIIVSSQIFQEEIYNRLKSYNMQEIEIIKIYNQEYREESTERSYAYYDENNNLKSNIPFDHLQRYGWALGYAEKKQVIDLACGSGYGTSWLSVVAAEAIGIDASREAIEHARNMYENSNCKFLCKDIYNITENLKADVIVSFETIEHIRNEDIFFETVNRLLKPNGILLISTPLAESDGENKENPFHVNEYTKKRFADTLSKYFDNILWYRQDSDFDNAVSIDDGDMERYNDSYITMLAVCRK